MMPWVHLHVDTRGKAHACCVGNIPFGNINSDSVATIWQGEGIRQFRQKMLRNEAEPRCGICYAREAAGATSMRQEVNAGYAHHWPAVATTQADGHAPDARPVYWDIRFSNLCNFRCRTCWHGASSRWYEEAQQLRATAGKTAVIAAARDPEAFLAQLAAILPEVEEIYFAGGEPLLMAEHFRLLQALVELGHTDIQLRYNTNFSRLDVGGQDLARWWQQFSRVTVGASLDASGRRGELLRKEQRWNKVEANRLWLMEKCPQVRFEIQPTVSVFNVLHLPDFHRAWVEKGWLAVDAWVPNLLERPFHYNVKVLPPTLKAEVVTRYTQHMAWLKHAQAKVQTHASFQETLDFMDKEDWSHRLPQFRKACAQLDQMRNESVPEVFPELRQLFETNS